MQEGRKEDEGRAVHTPRYRHTTLQGRLLEGGLPQSRDKDQDGYTMYAIVKRIFSHSECKGTTEVHIIFTPIP